MKLKVIGKGASCHLFNESSGHTISGWMSLKAEIEEMEEVAHRVNLYDELFQALKDLYTHAPDLPLDKPKAGFNNSFMRAIENAKLAIAKTFDIKKTEAKVKFKQGDNPKIGIVCVDVEGNKNPLNFYSPTNIHLSLVKGKKKLFFDLYDHDNYITEFKETYVLLIKEIVSIVNGYEVIKKQNYKMLQLLKKYHKLFYDNQEFQSADEFENVINFVIYGE